MTKVMAVVCCVLFAVQADAAPAAGRAQKALLEMAVGDPIEVKLVAGSKIRGRLDQVRHDGFNLKVAGSDRLETRSLAFSEVKSIKPIKGSKAGNIALYMLAGVGAFMLVAFSIAFAIAD